MLYRACLSSRWLLAQSFLQDPAELFDRVDADGDGEITVAELKAALELTELKPVTKASLYKTLGIFDEDGGYTVGCVRPHALHPSPPHLPGPSHTLCTPSSVMIVHNIDASAW